MILVISTAGVFILKAIGKTARRACFIHFLPVISAVIGLHKESLIG